MTQIKHARKEKKIKPKQSTWTSRLPPLCACVFVFFLLASFFFRFCFPRPSPSSSGDSSAPFRPSPRWLGGSVSVQKSKDNGGGGGGHEAPPPPPVVPTGRRTKEGRHIPHRRRGGAFHASKLASLLLLLLCGFSSSPLSHSLTLSSWAKQTCYGPKCYIYSKGPRSFTLLPLRHRSHPSGTRQGKAQGKQGNRGRDVTMATTMTSVCECACLFYGTSVCMCVCARVRGSCMTNEL